MKWISSGATPAYLWSFRSAPCVIKLAHVLFRSTPTDAHWHRALEHDCKIRPINGWLGREDTNYNGGMSHEENFILADGDHCGSARGLGGRQGHIRPGQVRPQSAEWARVLRVQGIRRLADHFYQS